MCEDFIHASFLNLLSKNEHKVAISTVWNYYRSKTFINKCFKMMTNGLLAKMMNKSQYFKLVFPLFYYYQGCDLPGFFLISGFFVTKISAILSIFSLILCAFSPILRYFFRIFYYFQDFSWKANHTPVLCGMLNRQYLRMQTGDFTLICGIRSHPVLENCSPVLSKAE